MDVAKHFDKVSQNYTSNRTGGLFGVLVDKFLVSREMAGFINKLKLNEKDLVLDAGCGDGLFSRILQNLGVRSFGVDISFNMLKKFISFGLAGVVGDLEFLPFKRKFTKVLCAGALEFVSKPEKAIASFNSVLLDDGGVIIMYPRCGFFGILYKLYHKIFHSINVNLFTNKKINKIFKSNNFKVLKITRVSIISNILLAKKLASNKVT